MITNFILDKLLGEVHRDWAVSAIYNIVIIERRILGAFAILGAMLYAFEAGGLRDQAAEMRRTPGG